MATPKKVVYSILLHRAVHPFKVDTMFATETFDKAKLQAEFDRLTETLQEGEDLEYCKATPRDISPSMLVVTRRRGILLRETRQGFTPYHPKELV